MMLAPFGKRGVKGERPMLRAIDDYFREHGHSPTIHEVATLTGIRSESTVRRELLSLEEQGLVEFTRVRAGSGLRHRSVRLTEDGKRRART